MLRGGEDRRQALVQAAFQHIAARGFEGLRLRQVAEAAGIDHSTLHHYFPTKEHLIGAVVEFATKQLHDSMPRMESPAATLRNHMEILCTRMDEQPELFTVLRELDLRAARDARVTGVIADNEYGWRMALMAVL